MKFQKGYKKGEFKEKSNAWKGGKITDKRGYVYIYKPEHPNAVGGYVREHRLVMEKYLGRYLENWEYIHHKNGIKTDNRIGNLDLIFTKKHYGKVCCPKCLFEFLVL